MVGNIALNRDEKKTVKNRIIEIGYKNGLDQSDISYDNDFSDVQFKNFMDQSLGI